MSSAPVRRPSRIARRARHSTAVPIVALILGATFATACGTKEAPGPLEPTGALARVRLVNLVSDPARVPVNVALENVPFAVNLAYGAAAPASLAAPSTATYASVLAGSRTFVLRRTADTAVTVATLGLNIGDGENRTVYAIGGTAGGAVSGVSTADTNAVPASGQARVRIANLSPTAGAIDVFVTAAGADLATATPVAVNLAYRATAAYLALPAGTYQLRAVPAGTAPASRGAAVSITLSGVSLTGGAGLTIVTADNAAGGTPLRAFVLRDQ